MPWQRRVRRTILLSGEHPTLPQAELRALLDVHDPGATVTPLVGRAVVVDPVDPERTDAALGRMALAHAHGLLVAADEDSPMGLARLAEAVAAQSDGKGSIAVEAVRAGTSRSPNALLAERTLGAGLAQAGHAIDLGGPDRTVFVWLLEGRAVAGRLHGRIDRSRFQQRVLRHRAHFSPVGLHPRRAASLVHLARVPPGGRILDPFCGTGGILLEAALEGHDAVGSDIDDRMVQGTLQALTDDGPEPLDGTAFVADVAQVPDLVDGVDGIVADLPYGVASGTRREPLVDLYGRAMIAVARVLPVGGHAVLGLSDLALLPPLDRLGLRMLEMHEEAVHRSLTRRFAVIKKIEEVAREA